MFIFYSWVLTELLLWLLKMSLAIAVFLGFFLCKFGILWLLYVVSVNPKCEASLLELLLLPDGNLMWSSLLCFFNLLHVVKLLESDWVIEVSKCFVDFKTSLLQGHCVLPALLELLELLLSVTDKYVLYIFRSLCLHDSDKDWASIIISSMFDMKWY